VTFIADKLKNNEPMKDIGESLLDWVMAKDTKTGRGTDNISLIIVLFKD